MYLNYVLKLSLEVATTDGNTTTAGAITECAFRTRATIAVGPAGEEMGVVIVHTTSSRGDSNGFTDINETSTHTSHR